MAPEILAGLPETSRHVPLRTCAGCRKVRPRPDLFRLTIDDHGRVTLGDGRRRSGRGVYLCRVGAQECLEAARRRRALTRSLRAGDDVIDYPELRLHLSACVQEGSPSPR